MHYLTNDGLFLFSVKLNRCCDLLEGAKMLFNIRRHCS